MSNCQAEIESGESQRLSEVSLRQGYREESDLDIDEWF
jgi:hypothetical protein